MTMQVGRGEHFRAASWLERGIERIRGARTRPAPAALRRLHELVLDLLPGDHLVSTLPGGERVRVSARHRHLSWNPEEYTAFKSSVRPGAIVLDVGANIGAYTVLFAQWTGASGRVIAFEPSPDSVLGLREHVRLNGVADRVEIVEAAVSSRDGSAAFDCAGASGANAIVADGTAIAGAITVRTTTLDAFCDARRLRPSMIKIDVEGAELDVLRGGAADAGAARAGRLRRVSPVDLGCPRHHARRDRVRACDTGAASRADRSIDRHLEHRGDLGAAAPDLNAHSHCQRGATGRRGRRDLPRRRWCRTSSRAGMRWRSCTPTRRVKPARRAS